MRSYRIRGDVRAARLGTLAAVRARWHGRMDGRRPVTSPDGHDGWTPFIGQCCDYASATSNQMITQLLDDHRVLVETVYKHADTVGKLHDTGTSVRGARGRFVAALTEWRTAAASARSAAEAAVNIANQAISCYWQAFLRSYPRATAARQAGGPIAVTTAGWRACRAELDPIWDKADALLLLTFGAEEDEATSQAGRILRNALEIVASCTCAACAPGPNDRKARTG